MFEALVNRIAMYSAEILCMRRKMNGKLQENYLRWCLSLLRENPKYLILEKTKNDSRKL